MTLKLKLLNFGLRVFPRGGQALPGPLPNIIAPFSVIEYPFPETLNMGASGEGTNEVHLCAKRSWVGSGEGLPSPRKASVSWGGPTLSQTPPKSASRKNEPHSYPIPLLPIRAEQGYKVRKALLS